MSTPDEEPRVRVKCRIESRDRGAIVQVDAGIFDVAFLWEFLGQAAYMQAYADGRLEVIHE